LEPSSSTSDPQSPPESAAPIVGEAEVSPDTSSVHKAFASGLKARPRGGGLKALVNAEPKKLSTLDKSKMDWESHVESSGADMKDELEANRRGGGYIEKVEFLGRVGERLTTKLESAKGKRKR
jgi:hypothetical protein